jgi:hypothetical protein
MPYSRIRLKGTNLYKVINTETKEVKANETTLENAKKQLKILRKLEKKEKNGGSLKASQIKKAIDLSYQGSKTTDAPKGYVIDKKLSNGRVKVYKDVNSDQALVVHRGSSGTKDWIDNVQYGLTGQMKSTETFKKHAKKHQKALDKYGADNVIAIGHSRAGKYVEELNKDKPVKEVITYNKASGPSDLFRKNPKNQTDIRTDIDVVSALAPLQSHQNKVVTIPSKSWNPLTAHGTTPLDKLGEKLLGKGFVGGSFNPKKLKVSEMRKFIKEFKKQNGEKWSGSKIPKPELVKIFETEILKNEKLEKPKLERQTNYMVNFPKEDFTPNFSEDMIGGNVWTDFVKTYAKKDNTTYGCAISDPRIKQAYKLFKEGKEWYIPKPSIKSSKIKFKEEPEIKEFTSDKSVDIDVIKEKINSTYGAYLALLKEFKKTLEQFIDDEWAQYAIKELKKIYDSLKLKYDEYSKIYSKLGGKKSDLIISEKYISKKLDEKININSLGNNFELVFDKKSIDDVDEWLNKVKQYFYKADKKIDELIKLNKLEEPEEEIDIPIEVEEPEEEIDIPIEVEEPEEEINIPIEVEEPEEEFKIPIEEKFIPSNIKENVNNIEMMLEKLKKAGQEKGAVNYDSSTIISNLAYIILIEKYGGKCVVSGVNKSSPNIIDVGLRINNDMKINDKNNKSIVNNLGKALKKCIDRGVQIIAIPLNLNFGTSTEAHANLLIYRPFQRIIERYEPNGISLDFDDERVFNDYLRKLFEVDLNSQLGDIRYREPKEICPNPRGFQSLESQIEGMEQEGGGFCSMWALFVMEMAFLNPEKSTKEILEKVYEITTGDPYYLKFIIRGYVLDIESKLDELFKYISSSSFRFNMKKPYMLIYDFSDELLNWIANVIFNSEKNIEPSLNFEPLPSKIDVIEENDPEKLFKKYSDKLSLLNIEQIKNIYKLYGITKLPPETKKVYIDNYLKLLFRGYLIEDGSVGFRDIDIILNEKLYNRSSPLPKNYFIDKIKQKPEPELEPELKPKIKSKPEPKQEPKPKSKPEPKPKPEPEPKPKPEPEPKKNMKKIIKILNNDLLNRKISISPFKNLYKKIIENMEYDPKNEEELFLVEGLVDNNLIQAEGIKMSKEAIKAKKFNELPYEEQLKIVKRQKGGSKLSQGFAKVAEKINPMSYAIKNKKTRNLMTSSGDVTHDYILPSVVEIGKPIAEAAAMGLSTMATGNPLLGKVVFDSLYKNMVSEKGYDVRKNQKSAALGKVSKALGQAGEVYVESKM